MNDKACFWIFKKNNLWAPLKAELVLTSLGLKEGRDAFNNKDQSLVMPFWVRSPQARLLKEFKQHWPAVELKYENPNYDSSSLRLRTLIRGGKQVAFIFIPLATLNNYDLLHWHLVRLHGYLEKIDALSQMPVDFYLDKVSSEGLTVHIEAIHEKTSDTVLNWMKQRMARHGLEISFTNHIQTPTFPEDSLGLATGLRIELSDELFLSDSPTARAFFAHEVQHVTNYSRRIKYGDASRQILFFAGDSNPKGLLGLAEDPISYNHFFQTDEYEAFRTNEKLDPDEYNVTSKHFLLNQISWLRQLWKELPVQLVRSEVDFNWYLEPEASPHVSTIEQNQRNYFKFTLNPESENEVIVLVPRLHERIQPRGNLRYLREVIGQRLRHLENHAKVRQLEDARQGLSRDSH